MSNDVQRPVFAAASGQTSQGDDFDLNEIFADYFVSEFEDPMNAYTASMANYAGGAVAISQTGIPTQSAAHVHQQAIATTTGEALPTGGIRTAFHAAAAGAVPAQKVAHYQHAPLAKKLKVEGQPLVAGVRPGGLTSRLGVPMPLIHSQTAQVGVPLAAPASGGISLPVGVGIKLGGPHGVAPATAQNAARVGAGFGMWAGVAGANVSDQAVAERRQRNREHAKRSRVRKKFMLESLQEQVASLQLENQRLRILVQDNIPEHAQQIISECCQSSSLFADSKKGDESKEDSDKPQALVRSDFQLMASLSSGQQNFVLSDPRLPDNPIVFATAGFYKLTGYTQEQVLGRNCRFLQGPGTNPKTVDIIRKAVATGADCTVCILNYKADGTPFWNQFFVAALRDSENCIVNYVGVQTEVEPDYGANALEDRVNAVLPLANKDDEDEAGEVAKES